MTMDGDDDDGGDDEAAGQLQLHRHAFGGGGGEAWAVQDQRHAEEVTCGARARGSW